MRFDSRRLSRCLGFPIVAVVCSLAVGVVACKQDEGERCEVDTDCSSGLSCQNFICTSNSPPPATGGSTGSNGTGGAGGVGGEGGGGGIGGAGGAPDAAGGSTDTGGGGAGGGNGGNGGNGGGSS